MASAEKTPLEKSMLIPTLTEDEVKIALGEKQVGSLKPTQSAEVYDFEYGHSLIFKLFQPSSWAQKLFKEENMFVKKTTNPSQPTHAGDGKAVGDKYSRTQRIPTSGFPTNSKASSMEQHNAIPGLFIAKKDEARPKKPNASTKRKLETVLATSLNPALKPRQVT